MKKKFELTPAQTESITLIGKVSVYFAACFGVGYLAGTAIYYATESLYDIIIGKDETFQCWTTALEEINKK